MDTIELLRTETKLNDLIMKVAKLHIEDRDNCICLVDDTTNEVIDWDNYRAIDLPNIDMVYKDECRRFVINCDAVFIFGDGTIEFHDAIDYDAYNWAWFNLDDLNYVIYLLEEKLNEVK